MGCYNKGKMQKGAICYLRKKSPKPKGWGDGSNFNGVGRGFFSVTSAVTCSSGARNLIETIMKVRSNIQYI